MLLAGDSPVTVLLWNMVQLSAHDVLHLVIIFRVCNPFIFKRKKIIKIELCAPTH